VSGFGGFFGLFGLILAVVGVMASAGAVASVAKLLGGLRSRDWPTVEGVVRESSLGRRVVPGRTARSEYYPAIVYDYEVEGRSYVSDRVAIGTVAASFAAGIERIVDEHRPGARVLVHHHPERPERAVLLVGPRPADLLQLALSLAVVVFVLSLLGGLGLDLDTMLGSLRRVVAR
jgi:hypothetical protein